MWLFCNDYNYCPYNINVVLLSVVVYSKYLQRFLLYNFAFPIPSFMQHVNICIHVNMLA